MQKGGFGHLPVCMAKTQYSFSDNAKLTAVSGAISLMPGLGKDPAALLLDVDAEGRITGLSA